MATISDQSQNCGKQILWYCVSIAHDRMHYGAADLTSIVSTDELNNNSKLNILHFFFIPKPTKMIVQGRPIHLLGINNFSNFKPH